MDIGVLQIQMMADLATLKRDMDDAKSVVGESMKSIEEAVGLAKSAFIAFTGVASVDAFKDMVEGSLKAVSGLHELSIQTGATVESLSGLAAVGKMTGTSAEDISGMMNKLAKNMLMANDESKGTGAAIAALGLNLTDFQAMSPDEKMKALAVAMNGFEDGSNKSAVAMQLLGKSGAQALPFLKDLAETGDLQVKVTTAQAEQANEFERSLKKLEASGDAWKKQLSLGMLPALQETATATLGLFNETGGLKDQIIKLSKDGTITEWARGAINGLTYVMDAFSGVIAVAKSAGIILAGMAAAVTSGSWDGMKAVIQGVGEDLDKTWGEKTLGQNLRERIAQVQDMGEKTKTAKPDIDVSQIHAGNAKAAKEQKDNYDALISSIEAQITTAQHELESSVALTGAEKELDKIHAAVEQGTSKLTYTELLNVEARLEALDVLERHMKMQKDEAKLQEEITKDRDADIQKMYAHTVSMKDENDKLAEQNLKLTMTAEAWAQHQAAMLRDQATALESTATTSDQSAELLKQAKILRDRADLITGGEILKEAKATADEWAKTTKQIGDGLSNALTDAVLKGHDIWTTFRDFMVKTILDGAIKSAFSSVIQGGISMLSSGGGGGGAGAILNAGASAAGGGGTSVGGAVVNAGLSAVGLGSGGAAAGASGVGFGSTMSAISTVAEYVPYVAAAVAALAVLNSIFGDKHYVASTGEAGTSFGADGTVVDKQKVLHSGGADADNKAFQVTSGLDQMYVDVAKKLGIQPEGAFFYFGSNDSDGGKFRVSAAVGSGTVYDSEEKSMAGGALQGAETAAVVAALRASTNDATKLDAIKTAFPGYASGGDFAGGLRIVGERGPELEATGPSRIFNAEQTASMLKSGGASGDELINEMRLSRMVLEQSLIATKALVKKLNNIAPADDAMQVRTVK